MMDPAPCHVRSSCRASAGAASLELVALTVAVVVLLAGVGAAFTGRGDAIARGMGATITGAAGGATGERAPAGRDQAPPRPGGLHQSRDGDVERVRQLGGSLALGDQDLQLRPLAPSRAVARRSWQVSRNGSGWHAEAVGDACLGCAGIAGRHEVAVGGHSRSGSTGRRAGDGVLLEGVVEGHVALAAAELRAAASHSLGAAIFAAQARASGTVGASGTLRGSFAAGTGRQGFDIGASGVIGATARVEQRIGVQVAGLALQQTAGAEGWAGLGGRAELEVERNGSRLEYRAAFGGALGLGGAFDVSGTVDTGGLDLSDHRKRLAVLRRTIVARAPQLAGMTLMPGGGI